MDLLLKTEMSTLSYMKESINFTVILQEILCEGSVRMEMIFFGGGMMNTGFVYL